MNNFVKEYKNYFNIDDIIDANYTLHIICFLYA